MLSSILVLLTVSSWAQQAPDPEVKQISAELARAMACQEYAGSLPVNITKSVKLKWSPRQVDDRGHPYATFDQFVMEPGLVAHVSVSSSVEGITPAVFASLGDGEMVALGDLSPNAGEASAWLRLHDAGMWRFFVLADTPGIKGKVTGKIEFINVVGMGMPAQLGTMLQTAAPSLDETEHVQVTADTAAGVHLGTLESGDETLGDGSWFDAFPFQLEAGQRLRLGALSSSYDLTLLLVPPMGEPFTSTSRDLTAETALIDHVATTSGEYVAAVAVKNGPPTGPYQFLVMEEMQGDICAQLQRLDVEDPWSLPGIEDSRVASVLRNRTLVDVMPWADECTVSSLGIVLGPGCHLRTETEAPAREVYERLVPEFQSCHTGWELVESSDDNSWSIEATRPDRSHRLRLSDEPGSGWMVNLWSMPLGE